MRRALIVVAKAPVAGRAKTRLSPPLSEQDAADLYRGFLLDTLDLAASLEWERTTLVHPRGDGRVLARLTATLPVHLLEQRSAGLADALAYAFEHHLSAGFDTAVLIGSDNPTLAAASIHEACGSLLGGADLTLGPTADGGYYLIGMRQPRIGVFEGIEWSTPHVYAQTLSRASALRLRVHQVAEWYDVDEAADLRRLVDELAEAPPTLARHTRLVLERLRQTSPSAAAAAASAAHRHAVRTRA
jgi:rSAM/selenodomain-associated transferase 1